MFGRYFKNVPLPLINDYFLFQSSQAKHHYSATITNSFVHPTLNQQRKILTNCQIIFTKNKYENYNFKQVVLNDRIVSRNISTVDNTNESKLDTSDLHHFKSIR